VIYNMTMQDAMEQRHTVRHFTATKLSAETIRRLQERTDANNLENDLSIRLIIDNTDALGFFAKLFLGKNVRNYWILAAPDHPDSEEKLGYCGTDLMLYAQTLGLNTWWVGGTYNRKGAQDKSEGAKPVGIIAVGYGQTQGVPHKTKTAEQVSSYDGEAPQWFKDGIEAALLAPTALAKQAFIISGSKSKVSISCDNGIFTGVDTGLVKYHFELGAGKENFEWV